MSRKKGLGRKSRNVYGYVMSLGLSVTMMAIVWGGTSLFNSLYQGSHTPSLAKSGFDKVMSHTERPASATQLVQDVQAITAESSRLMSEGAEKIPVGALKSDPFSPMEVRH